MDDQIQDFDFVSSRDFASPLLSHSHQGVWDLSHSRFKFNTVTGTSSILSSRRLSRLYRRVLSPVSRSLRRVTSLWLKHLAVSRLRCKRSWICLKEKEQESVVGYYWHRKVNLQERIIRSTCNVPRSMHLQACLLNTYVEFVVLQTPSPVLVGHSIQQLIMIDF